IDLEQAIGFFNVYDLLDRDVAGSPLPPGLSVTRDPVDGLVLNIVEGYSNLGGVETSGVDLNARFSFEIGPGRLNSNLQLSHVFEYKVRVDDTHEPRNQIGDPGRPQSRATFSNSYEWGDLGFAWNINYIADTYDEIVDGQGQGHVPTWVTHDVQVNYHTAWDGRLTVGAQNVLSRKPPVGVAESIARTYNFDLFNGYGRILYFRYTQVY
ncbi:MAG: TonB-dependent receptor, partial [Xanthomonadales bacterium]|nr:TonB-dependent receptor [Xanthomonadales bacterium]